MDAAQKILIHLHIHGISSSDGIVKTTCIKKAIVLRTLVSLKQAGKIQKVRTLLPGDDIKYADKVIFVKYRLQKKPPAYIQPQLF